MKLSVVIATKDRGPEINLTIDSLIQQSIGLFSFEILLIDNGSKQENANFLQEITQKNPHLIHYFREDQLGLSIARNRGIQESKNDIIVFLDDDAIAKPKWLESLQQCFIAHPEIAAIGGKVTSQYSVPMPDWIRKDLEPYLSGFDKGNQMLKLEYNEYPRGVNMAFRKTIFEKTAWFNKYFGRKGSSLMSYEEIELCYRIEKLGGKIVYLPTAEVIHLIKMERISKEWFKTRIYWQGRSEGLFEWMHFGKIATLKKIKQTLKDYYYVQDPFQKKFYKGFIHAVLLNLLPWR
jgi:glucosyl-dolichyl phosphate glucuronosyltransferase